MKHFTRTAFLIILILCVGCIIVSAHNKLLQVYKGGDVIQSFIVSDLDSIKFVDVTDYVNPDDEKGVVINGVRWATRNVGEPGTFVKSPENLGNFYQWNRNTSWASSGTVENWDASMPTGNTWSYENLPCPPGWRLPTKEEMQSLVDAGSEWTIVNGVAGRKFGSGENCIFMPAGGYLHRTDGSIQNNGYYLDYWTSSVYSGDNAYLLFGGSGAAYLNHDCKNYGLQLRCVADVPAEIGVENIVLNKNHIDIKIGDKYQLQATILPENASHKDVTWQSIFSSIVLVDDKGLVTALAEGEGLVRAYAGDKYATCEISVHNSNSYNEGVVINGIKWATCNVGEPGKFAESPEAAGMFYQWDEYAGWSNTDSSISVPVGSEWIKRNYDDPNANACNTSWTESNSPCPDGWRIPTKTELESLVNAGYKKTVQNGVQGYVFGSEGNTIFIPGAGKKASLTGTLYTNGTSGNYWSDTPNLNMNEGYLFNLSFDEKNKPNVNAYGDRYAGFSIRCVADDYIPVSSITLDKTTLSLQLGDSYKLTANILPENASNKHIIWSSSDKSVVSVNNNTCEIYAKGPGRSTITAQIDDQVASCEVCVSGVAQTGIHLNKSKLSLKVGESYNLMASVTPPDATFNSVKWTSLDPSIATVDQTGKVTAVKEGITSINAATKRMSTGCTVIINKTGGDGGSTSDDSGNVTSKTFTSAQLYYYGNLSSNTTYFRLSLFNPTDFDGLVIEGFCDKAYSFDNFILDSGTYTFSSTYGKAKTFIEGEFFGDPSTDGRYMGTYYYRSSGCILFDGGTITISKSGSTYTLSTNLNGYSYASTATYKNLNFKYSGQPEIINFFK